MFELAHVLQILIGKRSSNGREQILIMARTKKAHPDFVVLKMFTKNTADVTDAELAHFRVHPEQIDRITAPVNIHRLFLWSGALLGAIFFTISKILRYSELLGHLSEGAREFILDLASEIGVALLGAAITAYFLGILLNRQQENAAQWRAEIRRRIAELEQSDSQPAQNPGTERS